MGRRLNRRIVVLALLASITAIGAGGYWLWSSAQGNDRPVTLLAERVTLGPEPLVIDAPRGTDASGTSFLLTIHIVREKTCEGSKWAKDEAKYLPVVHAVAVTSDGRRHPILPDDCCFASTCGALTLYRRTDSAGGRDLTRVELSSPGSVPIEKVTWTSWSSKIGHLSLGIYEFSF